eukprot:scaffold25864_cov140-Isochrysis_galbana.AAC.6
MSASLSASLRADYGGALIRCVAMFGRADQHSAGAGAEGAPYRLSIEVMGAAAAPANAATSAAPTVATPLEQRGATLRKLLTTCQRRSAGVILNLYVWVR